MNYVDTMPGPQYNVCATRTHIYLELVKCSVAWPAEGNHPFR